MTTTTSKLSHFSRISQRVTRCGYNFTKSVKSFRAQPLSDKLFTTYIVGGAITFGTVFVGNTAFGVLKTTYDNSDGRPFMRAFWGGMHGAGFGLYKGITFTPLWFMFWSNAWYEHYTAHARKQGNSTYYNPYHIMRHFIPNSNHDISKFGFYYTEYGFGPFNNQISFDNFGLTHSGREKFYINSSFGISCRDPTIRTK